MAYYGNEPSKVAVTVGQGVIDASHIEDASISTLDISNDAITQNKIDDDGTGFQMGSLGLGGAVSGEEKLTVTGTASFSGAITGDVSGSSATVTGATQSAITSTANLATVGTITSGVWNAGAVTSSGDVISSGRVKGDRLSVMEGSSTIGHLIREETVTGAGTSNDLCLFSETGLDLHFMTGGSVTKVLTLDASNNATFAGDLSVTGSQKKTTLTNTSTSGCSMLRIHNKSTLGGLWSDNNIIEAHGSGSGNAGQVLLYLKQHENNASRPIIQCHNSSAQVFEIGSTGKATFGGDVQCKKGYIYNGDGNNNYEALKLDSYVGGDFNGDESIYITFWMRDSNHNPSSAGEHGSIRVAVTNAANSVALENEGTMQFYTNNGSSSAERMRLTSGGDLHVDGDITAYSSTISDVTLKEEITPITNALNVINQIDTIRYKYNYQEGYHYGIKAQQLENLIPEIVKETDLPFHGQGKKLTVRDKELIPFLISAVKEQQIQIESLKTQIGET